MKIVDLNELALKKVIITGNVIGKFGTFEIEQTFKNNTSNVLEVEYTFPIVETATVIGFEIVIGDKVLKGKCKDKEKAKKEYHQNMVKGNSAYMMEQQTNNVFKISVGKIDKDEEVKIKINYIDKFEITDNTIKILIPTLVTPKYKSNITNKLTYGETSYTVDFKVYIDKILNIKNIECISHKINLIDKNEVEVLNYDLSKDFILNVELKNELASNASISKTRDNKNIVYLSFMPEFNDVYEDEQKEYLFIVDISGSMYGEKLDETKRAVIECLKQLDIEDKFNIIPFESEFEAMNITSLEFNDENLQKAIEYINHLKTMGGTEILNPIKFALYDNSDKIILLFTDGQVGNEDEIIGYVKNNIKKSRIFPFGIDTNVNSSFIRELAKVGNGKFELIQPNEKIDEKIIRTFSRIQTPLLEELKIDFGKNKVIDEILEENTLFNYEFFNLFAKIEKLQDDIILKGKILNKEYSWKIEKENIENANVDLEILFAKMEIERLEEYIENTYDSDKRKTYIDMIIDLSEKYNINSKYTSFITVYERDNKLFEVPVHQNTPLSNKFSKRATFFNKITSCLSVADEDCDNYDSVDLPTSSNTLDIPTFLRKTSTKVTKEKPIEDILHEKVIEYYKIFILQKEKQTLTYLLYAIYYLKNNMNFNCKELFKFLSDNKDVLLSNELFEKLMYVIYNQLESEDDKQKVLNLVDDKYKKIIYTGLKINMDLKMITEDEIKNILSNDKVTENINDILWYLYNMR